MAKKDKKKSKKKDNSGTDAVGAVRTAVGRTFQATADSAQSTRTRAQDLVDEVAGAAGRLREMIEQLSVLEDLKKQVEALTSRVAALERGGDAAKSTAKRGSTASRSTASRAKSGGTTKAKSSGTTRAKSGGTTRAKSSSSSRSTSKPASSTRAKRSTAKKPASSRSTAAKKS